VTRFGERVDRWVNAHVELVVPLDVSPDASNHDKLEAARKRLRAVLDVFDTDRAMVGRVWHETVGAEDPGEPPSVPDPPDDLSELPCIDHGIVGCGDCNEHHSPAVVHSTLRASDRVEWWTHGPKHAAGTVQEVADDGTARVRGDGWSYDTWVSVGRLRRLDV